MLKFPSSGIVRGSSVDTMDTIFSVYWGNFWGHYMMHWHIQNLDTLDKKYSAALYNTVSKVKFNIIITITTTPNAIFGLSVSYLCLFCH